MSVSENLKKIREALGSNKVKIVAVAKLQTAEKIREAVLAGIKDFGVNYTQEGESLLEELKDLSLTWHFIGHIQSRKVKNLLNYSLIQSMDRWDLILDLDKRAEASNQVKEILIEINIGNEPQKSGILPAALPELLDKAKKLKHVKVRGLMAMPPALDPIEKRRPYFDSMHTLFLKNGFDSKNHFLSMGTSEDYEIAVRAGSNMVRLGTCLLGKRPTS